jgi:hypothetical protein
MKHTHLKKLTEINMVAMMLTFILGAPLLRAQSVAMTHLVEYAADSDGIKVDVSIGWPSPEDTHPDTVFAIFHGDEEFPYSGTMKSEIEVVLKRANGNTLILSRKDEGGIERWVGTISWGGAGGNQFVDPIVLDRKINIAAPGPVRASRFDYDKSRLDDLRSRHVSENDIAHWTSAQIRYAINFIYARNGYAFKGSGPIRSVFNSMDWYEPLEGVSMEEIDARMNSFETSNIKVLAKIRSSQG